MNKSLPAFNPITAPDAYCYCGQMMKKSPVKGPSGKVTAVSYRCINPESGCRYEIEHDIRLTGSARLVPAEAKKE